MSLAVLQQAALLSSQRAAAAAAAATAQSQTAEAPGGDTSHQDTTSHPNNNNPANNNENMTNPASAATSSAAAGASAPGQIVVTEQDVLCGRGGETNHHPGNVAYRTLVKTHQPLYIKAKRRDKPKIARAIVDTIMLQYGGRFLKRATSEDGDLPEPPASSASQQQQQWVEISVQKAREKTSQALRENAPNLRNKEQEEILMAERQKQIRTDQRIEHQLAEEAKREAVFQKIMEHQLVAQQQDKQRAAAAAAAAEASAAAVVLKAAAAQAQKAEHDGRSSLLGATMATQQHQHPHQQHHHQHPAPYILKSHAPAPAQRGHTKSNLAPSVPGSLASKQDVGSSRLRDFLGTNVGHGHGNTSDVTLPNGSGDDRIRCTTDFLPGVLHHSSTNGVSSATRSYLFDGTGKRPTGSAGTISGAHQSHCSSTSEADAHATAVANLIRANERSARYPSTSSGDCEAAGPASNSTLSHLFTHTRTDPSSNLRDTSPVKALLYEHLYGRLAGGSSSGTTSNTTAGVPQHPFYHNHHLHHQPRRHYNHEPETIAPDREGKGPWANRAMKDTLARSQIAHELARSATTGATGTVFEPTKTSHPYNLYDRSINAAALARTRSASEHLVLSDEITSKASSSDKYLPSRAMTSSDARRIAHQDDSNAAAYPKDVAGTSGSVDIRPRDRSTSTTGPTTHTSDLSNPANRMEGDEAIAAAAFLQLFNAGSSGSNRSQDNDDVKCKTNAAATSSPKMTGSSAPSSSTNSSTVAPISPTSDSSRNTTSSGGLSCASGDEGVGSSAPARGVGPRLKRFKRRLEEESEVVQGSPQKLMRQQEQRPPQLPFNVSQ